MDLAMVLEHPLLAFNHTFQYQFLNYFQIIYLSNFTYLSTNLSIKTSMVVSFFSYQHIFLSIFPSIILIIYLSIYRVFIKYCVFFLIFQNIPNSVFPRCQFVYTKQAGRNPALQQNWQSSEKSQNFKENTQYLMNTLYLYI